MQSGNLFYKFVEKKICWVVNYDRQKTSPTTAYRYDFYHRFTRGFPEVQLNFTTPDFC